MLYTSMKKNTKEKKEENSARECSARLSEICYIKGSGSAAFSCLLANLLREAKIKQILQNFNLAIINRLICDQFPWKHVVEPSPAVKIRIDVLLQHGDDN